MVIRSRSQFLPPVFFKFRQQVLHFTGIPVFYFLFLILYKPFNSQIKFSFENGGFAFNVAISTAILFVTLLITRILLWGLRNVASFKRGTYVLWCIGEILIASLFISLYVFLISGKAWPYIDVVPFTLAYLAGVLIFPYLLIFTVLESDVVRRYVEAADEGDLTRMRFYDERRNLKLVTESSSILYIRSDENYCNIFYTEGEKVKNFMLRNTMKRLDEQCEKNGILRCHRSYYVNVRRISVLRREREGLTFAEMDIPGVSEIPVTKRYYGRISEML